MRNLKKGQAHEEFVAFEEGRVKFKVTMVVSDGNVQEKKLSFMDRLSSKKDDKRCVSEIIKPQICSEKVQEEVSEIDGSDPDAQYKLDKIVIKLSADYQIHLNNKISYLKYRVQYTDNKDFDG